MHITFTSHPQHRTCSQQKVHLVSWVWKYARRKHKLSNVLSPRRVRSLEQTTPTAEKALSASTLVGVTDIKQLYASCRCRPRVPPDSNNVISWRITFIRSFPLLVLVTSVLVGIQVWIARAISCSTDKGLLVAASWTTTGSSSVLAGSVFEFECVDRVESGVLLPSESTSFSTSFFITVLICALFGTENNTLSSPSDSWSLIFGFCKY